MRPVAELIRHRELLYNLVLRNLKSRYKDSALGFLWSLLTPLIMALIYLVFLRLLARGVPLTDILIGVFAWQFTAQSVANGLTSITENANLVKKVAFPRLILPVATTGSNLVNFLLSLIVQFVLVVALLAFHGQHLSPAVLAVPLVIAYHTLFCLALALLVAGINVYFRDLQHLVSLLMTAWFFMSPAMYSLALVIEMARNYGAPMLASVYMLNPMAVIITAYRALILPDAVFPFTAWSAAGAVIPLILLLGAYILFQKLQRNFSDYL